MFQLGNTIVSEEIIENDFVCNLNACKGACCVDGDAGAPLSQAETKVLKDIYPQIKPYLRQEGIKQYFIACKFCNYLLIFFCLLPSEVSKCRRSPEPLSVRARGCPGRAALVEGDIADQRFVRLGGCEQVLQAL